MRDCLKDLKGFGFAKLHGEILSRNEIQELGRLIGGLFESRSINCDMSSNAPVIIDLLGMDPKIDLLLEKIIGHPDVQSVLSQVVGSEYKIWEISVRRSEAGDKGLYLHQDAPGQTDFVFSLTDNLAGDGGTAFLPKSHLLPRWAHKISWTNVSISSQFLEPLRLRAGEAAFFFNRTWHIRRKNKTQRQHDVIFFAFFPQGAMFTPKKWIQDNLASWHDPALRQLLDASIGTRKLDDGRVIVESSDNVVASAKPYSMQLEEVVAAKDVPILSGLRIKIFLLEMVFRPLRMVARLVRSISGKSIHLPAKGVIDK